MIRLFFLNLIFVFLSVNVIADPFTQEIGIIKEVITEPIIEEIKEFEKVVEVIEDETEVIEEEIIIEKVAVEKVKDIFVEDKKVVSSKIINLNPLTAYSLKEYVLKGIATRKAKQRDTKFKRIKVSNYDYGKTPTIHTVKKNEDLNTIAFRYGFSVN